MVINLDWLLVEAAFVVATALLGFIIGWKYMAIWTVGVFLSTLVAAKIGPKLELLLNKLIAVIAQFLGIALNGNENALKAPSVGIPDNILPLATAGFFLFLVLFSYWVARKLGNNVDVGIVGKIVGTVFGALGAILALSEISSYYQQYVAKSGRDPLSGAINLSVPSLVIDVGGPSGATNWSSLGTLAIALFLLLLVVYTIWRVVRNVIFH
ncbi:MAG: hypothetical protein ACR2M0_12180 [Chloroflexia bacterium]